MLSLGFVFLVFPTLLTSLVLAVWLMWYCIAMYSAAYRLGSCTWNYFGTFCFFVPDVTSINDVVGISAALILWSHLQGSEKPRFLKMPNPLGFIRFWALLGFQISLFEQAVGNSVSVKEIFQRVTDAWFLKFVRQRENCESQWLSVYFQFWSHTVPPPIPIKIIMPHWVIRPIVYYALRAALVAVASRVTV